MTKYVSQSLIHNTINKISTKAMAASYKHIIKPYFVFNHDPDTAHDQMIQFCRITKNIPPLMFALKYTIQYTSPMLETNVMGIPFTNPFGLSAGLDKNCDMPILLDNAGFGFETVGSTTARPCEGNPKPWFHRFPEYNSMSVHVGLANDGSEHVIPRVEEAWKHSRSMKLSI
ncbi:MAG: quinone-dependent dihydroorotate dehydrogenase, partial [Bifidobacteriaceae bacterium]|nr:quinone-dependent dihydroorotate dehydrogenase [Bifidobacteriaceae bacterium]